MISEPLARDGFVGRREELAFLLETFAQTRDEGRTRFVPVEGEAGIGKSRLIDEFVSGVASEAVVVAGQCSEQVRSPYRPFFAILERIATRGARSPFGPRRGRGNSAEKAAFFDETARLFERTSRRKPIVATVEDLQWADSATLELLGYLMQNLDAARVLFLISLRTEGAAGNPALAAFRLQAARRRITALQLRGLRRNEIRYLVVQRLGIVGAAAIPAQTVAQIETLCEGNPLYAEELTRAVSESGGVDLAAHAPLSLQAMLSERLTPLAQEERAVLVRAAIVGRRFDAAFLAKIVGLPIERVLGALQRAVEAGLVVGSAAEPLDFAFRHAMIRQALADQLIVGLAAPLHVRIAEELEALDGPERAAELAYHWSAARVAGKARAYNERAAEAAWSVYAYRDAIGFYTMALRWEYPPGAQRAAIYERLGTLLYIEGCGEEPTIWFEKCRAEYERLENPAGAAHALLRLADQYWVDARTGDSLTAAARAAAALERLQRPEMLAEALLSIARFSVTTGDALSAHARLTEAHALARHFDVTLQANFHEVRAETHAALGHASVALADCRLASQLAARTGVSETIAQVENNFALVAADLAELALAAERHEIALAEARRTSMPWRVAYSALNYASTLMLQGELQRARALVWEAIESGVTTATVKTKAAAIGIPLALLLNDRRLLESVAGDEALEHAQRSREAQRIGATAAAFAELRAAQSSADEARALLAHAAASIERPHRCASLLLQIAIDGGGAERRWARQTFTQWPARPRVKRACRLFFEALDCAEQPRAVRLAALSAAAFARIGWRLHQARALEKAGRLTDAAAIYAACGDVRDLERIGSQPSSAPIALSGRQMEVARLVADGETNRAIACRLHISEHTVEHHLSTIFARLGLRSRSALAARIGRLTAT